MGLPAAKFMDQIIATVYPYSGFIDKALSPNVKITGLMAATVGSIATNPSNGATCPVLRGSSTVFINGKPAARQGDPGVIPTSIVIALPGTVFIGG